MQKVEFKVGGHTVRGELHLPSDHGVPAPPKAAVVMLHGLNSRIVEFGELPAHLARHGYAALAFDQRGFGASEGEPGLTSPEQAIVEAEAAADVVAKHAPGRPVGILGHSLGGAYAVHALGASPRWAFGVLVSPLDRIWDEIGPLSRGAYHILGRLSRRRVAKGGKAGHVPYSVHYSEIFVSKEAARAANRPDFLMKKANLGNYAMAMAARASDVAGAVKVPVLGVWTPLDRAVKPAHSLALMARLGRSPELLEHKGGHSAFLDLDGERVAAGIVAWLDRTVPALEA